MVVASTTGRPGGAVPGEHRLGERLHHRGQLLGDRLGGGLDGRPRAPFDSATAWRASAIDGSVSPIVLNTRNSSRSPGIERDTSPAERIASENTSPLAPGEQRPIEVEERRTT